MAGSNRRSIPLSSNQLEGSDVHDTDVSWDDGHGMASSYSDAMARSMELSYLLLGRSPWMAMSPPNGMATREAQEVARNRSISIASNYRDGGSTNGSQRSVQVEEGDISEPFLKPAGMRKADASYVSGDGSQDYDPFTGEPLPDLDAEDKYEDGPSLSSFWQSVFNSTNLLMGVGLLSLPYACHLGGWMTIGIMIVFGLITNHTAKLLGEIMEYQTDVKLRDGPGAYTIYGFADMGMVAFGDAGRYAMTILFIIETFGYACVYIIIEGENLKSQLGSMDLFSSWRNEHFLLLSACVFLPPMWLPNLSLLSYMSAFGVFASSFLLFGVAFEGGASMEPNKAMCKPPCTGSWINPSPTEWYKFGDLPIVIGLIMVGFSGHAVFPTIKNDMAEKRHYNRMVDITYVFVLTAYVAMSVCGYLMYGDQVNEQITLNLGRSVVSHVIVWVVISNPICKYPLDMAPIAFGVEQFAAITFRLPYKSWVYTCVSLLIRTMLVFISLAAVIAIPSFAMLVALLGSFGSFTICVTFPCACYLKLFWKDLSLGGKCLNVLLVAIGIVGAAVGTWSAIMGHGVANLVTVTTP